MLRLNRITSIRTQHHTIPLVALSFLLSTTTVAQDLDEPPYFKGIYADEASRASVVIAGGSAGKAGKVGVAQESPETQLDVKGSFRVQEAGGQLIIGDADLIKKLLGKEIDVIPWLFAGGSLGVSGNVYPMENGAALGTEKYPFNSLWLSPDGLTMGPIQNQATLSSTSSTVVLAIKDAAASLDDQGTFHASAIELGSLKNCGSDAKGYSAKIDGLGRLTCGEGIAERETKRQQDEKTLSENIDNVSKSVKNVRDTVTSVKDSIDSLNKTVDTVRKAADAAKSMAETATAVAEATEAGIGATVVAAVTAEFLVATVEISGFSASASNSASSAEGAEKQAKQAADNAQRSARTASDALSKITDIDNRVSQVDGKMAGVSDDASKLLDEIRQEKIEIESVRTELDARQANLDNQLSQLQEQEHALETRVREAEQDIDSKAEDYLNSFDRGKDQLDTLFTDVRDARESFIQSLDELEGKRQAFDDTLEDNLGTIQSTAVQALSDIEKAKKAIEQKQQILDVKLVTAQHQMEDGTQNLTEVINEGKSELQQMIDRVTSHELAISQRVGEIVAVKDQVDNSIQSLSQRISAIETKLQRVESTVEFTSPLAFAARCRLQLESINRSSGKPGSELVLSGNFGDAQGKKLPVINRGGQNPLTVTSWSNTMIRTKIPDNLSAGAYKVGVYCVDPYSVKGASHSSGFLDYEVLGQQ